MCLIQGKSNNSWFRWFPASVSDVFFFFVARRTYVKLKYKADTVSDVKEIFSASSLVKFCVNGTSFVAAHGNN